MPASYKIDQFTSVFYEITYTCKVILNGVKYYGVRRDKSKFHVLNYNIWLLVYLLYESKEMQYMIDYS